ncbi:MAG: hypothetical protein RLZZ546_2545 [Bacteroidota bacterium]
MIKARKVVEAKYRFNKTLKADHEMLLSALENAYIELKNIQKVVEALY